MLLGKKKQKTFSDKLNGCWEEGYHYYLTFDNDRLIVRDYRRAVAIETTVTYDAEALERGERTVITPADNVLSRDASGKPFTMIRELACENGELKLLYYYTIMGETLYTLKKVDHGPFDHIVIRDKEFLDRLQGEWLTWRSDGDHDKYPLTIKGNRLFWFEPTGIPFHVISYKTDLSRVMIVPENLTDSDFGFCTSFEVLPDMLTTRFIVMDASVPLTVLARWDKIDTLEIPPEAREPIRNTMRDYRMVDEPPAIRKTDEP